MSAGEVSFGEMLRAYRVAARLTQEGLAERTGLSTRTIRALESGRNRRPRPPSLSLLATALELTGAERDRFQRLGQDEYWSRRGGTEPPHGAGVAAAAGSVPGEAVPVQPSGRGPDGWAGGPAVTPAQLPADAAHFTGRVAELRGLDALVSARDVRSAPAVAVLSGTAGVGKTALAVHWAHRVRREFPDGALYVNLRGFDPGGQVTDPALAVRGFLDALGVAAERVPATLDAQVGLYRSLLADRRVLVVLDNARDAEQVRPLLPGAPGCLVVVTSRNQLTGLVAADGAYPLTLDLLTAAEAHELLARRLGADRVAGESSAVEQIIGACAGLPLALTIAAARARQTGFPLATLAADLTDVRGRLDALAAGDPASEVRAVFSWSYAALTPPAARLFRLLGSHPGPDTSAAAAASMAGHALSETRPLLAELTRASLLAEHAPGRYTFHDLLRAYAAELAHSTDTDAARQAVTTRVLDHYVHTAYAADHLLDRTREPPALPPAAPAPGVSPEHLLDHQQAMAWLAAERPVLLATVRRAADARFDTHAWQLAWALDTFLDRQGHWHDLIASWQSALPAVDRLDEPAAQAFAYRLLGWANVRLDRYPEAHAHLGRALDLYARAGDRTGQAHTYYALGHVCDRQGRLGPALDHAQQALALFRAAEHRFGQAMALNAIGWCHSLRGDHTRAVIHCEQSLTLLQQLDDRDGQAATWDSLGYAHLQLGHHASAVDCYQHSVDLYRQLGDRYGEAAILAHLGDAQHAGGNRTAAGAAWQRTLEILTDLDHPDAEAVRTKLHDLDQPAQGSRSGSE